MNGPSEIQYKPVGCSDVTIHFGNSAFHVHSTILKKESTVLDAALDGANCQCELTEACKKPSHRCFVLTSPFGTTAVNDHQMKSFFDHMYEPTKVLITPGCFGPISKDGQHILIGSTVHPQNTAVWSSGEVTGFVGSQVNVSTVINRRSTVMSISAAELKLFATVSKPFQRIGLKKFLYASDAVIRLCHFFDCSVLTRMFESYISTLLDDTTVQKDATDMFELLSLCDYCHFNSLGRPVVIWLLDNKASLDLSELDRFMKTIRSETSIMVMRVVFGKR